MSPAAAQEPIGNRPVAPVVKRELDAVFAWPGTVSAQITAQIAPKVTGRILDITVRAGTGSGAGRCWLAWTKASSRPAWARPVPPWQPPKRKPGGPPPRPGGSRTCSTGTPPPAGISTRRWLRRAAPRPRSGRLREAVRATESQLGETVLVAPFDGTVVRRHQEPGDMALPGSPVLTLQQSQRLRIESAVPAHCAGFLRLEQVLKVRLAHPPASSRRWWTKSNRPPIPRPAPCWSRPGCRRRRGYPRAPSAGSTKAAARPRPCWCPPPR